MTVEGPPPPAMTYPVPNCELRKQLFGYDERPHGSRGFGRRDDDRDNRYHDRGRRPRSRSPGYRGGRGKGRGRRSRSPVREGSAERRAKIEQWNREREQMPFGDKNNNKDSNSDGGGQNGAQYHDLQQQHDEYNYSSS